MKYFLDTEFHEYEKELHVLSQGGKFDHEWGTYNEIHTVHKTPTIDLISIGIVAEDDREYYAISKEFDVEAAWENEWLRENVLKSLYEGLIDEYWNKKCFRKTVEYSDLSVSNLKSNFTLERLRSLIQQYGKSRKQIAEEIKEFVGKDPEFYAYYADYDWVVFCWLFGRMIDLPDEFPMYCRDLKQILDEKQEKRSGIVKMMLAKPSLRGDLKLGDLYNVEFFKNLPGYPKQDNEHNALDDAKWNKELHEFLKKI